MPTTPTKPCQYRSLVKLTISGPGCLVGFCVADPFNPREEDCNLYTAIIENSSQLAALKAFGFLRRVGCKRRNPDDGKVAGLAA